MGSQNALATTPPATGLYGENTVLDHLPGSDGWPLLGHTFDYLGNTYPFGQAMRARFGEVYRSRAFFMRFAVLASADGIEYVLRDDAQNFSSKLGWEPFSRGSSRTGCPRWTSRSTATTGASCRASSGPRR